jgi:hypothetical protein
VCERYGKQNSTCAPAYAAVLSARANIKQAREGSEMCCAHHQMIVYLLQAVNLGFTLCQCRTKVFACRRHTHSWKKTTKILSALIHALRVLWALQDSYDANAVPLCFFAGNLFLRKKLAVSYFWGNLNNGKIHRCTMVQFMSILNFDCRTSINKHLKLNFLILRVPLYVGRI